MSDLFLLRKTERCKGSRRPKSVGQCYCKSLHSLCFRILLTSLVSHERSTVSFIFQWWGRYNHFFNIIILMSNAISNRSGHQFRNVSYCKLNELKNKFQVWKCMVFSDVLKCTMRKTWSYQSVPKFWYWLFRCQEMW